MDPIWVVRVGNDLYVRSVFGAEGGWYRAAMRDRRARIRAGNVESDVTLEPAADDVTNNAVNTAYRTKYSDQPTGLQPMVKTTAAETTVRLTPR